MQRGKLTYGNIDSCSLGPSTEFAYLFLHYRYWKRGNVTSPDDSFLFSEGPRDLAHPFSRKKIQVKFGFKDPRGDLAKFRRAIVTADQSSKYRVDEIVIDLLPALPDEDHHISQRHLSSRRWRAAQQFLSFKDFTCSNLRWPPLKGSNFKTRICNQKCDGTAIAA